jgi:branched-chain amino acid transport system permease protein
VGNALLATDFDSRVGNTTERTSWNQIEVLVVETKKHLKVFLVCLGIMLILPIFVHGRSDIMHILIISFFWSVVAVSWDLLMGYAGIFSFGQIAFFTVGGYGTGMLTKYLGLSPWLGVLAGGVIACMVAAGIGVPCLRLAGIYVALVTFALHEALLAFIRVGRVIGTGGGTSLTGIPPLSIGEYSFPFMNRVPWYYVALGLGFLSYFIIMKIIHSPMGLSFVALRDSKDFAKSLGINEYKSKLIVFGIAGFFAGIAGAFYVHYMRLVSVRILGLDAFVLLLVILIVGGLGKFPGVIVSTFFFIFANEYLRPLQVYRPIILGGIVIVAIIYMPQGIGGALDYIGQLYGRITNNGRMPAMAKIRKQMTTKKGG